MDSELVRRARGSESEGILESLSAQQYLRPLQSVGEALGVASSSVGFCPGAAEQAMQWLRLDAGKPIGRLRRTELMQLARSIERFWRQARREQEEKREERV